MIEPAVEGETAQGREQREARNTAMTAANDVTREPWRERLAWQQARSWMYELTDLRAAPQLQFKTAPLASGGGRQSRPILPVCDMSSLSSGTSAFERGGVTE